MIKYQNLLPKKRIKVHERHGNADIRYKPSKQIRLKHQCYNQIYAIAVMYILLLKELLLLQIQILLNMIKK